MRLLLLGLLVARLLQLLQSLSEMSLGLLLRLFGVCVGRHDERRDSGERESESESGPGRSHLWRFSPGFQAGEKVLERRSGDRIAG